MEKRKLNIRLNKLYLVAVSILLANPSCTQKSTKNQTLNSTSQADNSQAQEDKTNTSTHTLVWLSDTTEVPLCKITDIDSSLQVDLKYASTHNFTNQVLYTQLKEAYLQEEVAHMLAKAQQLLKAIHPRYTLVVYDAARPLSVQAEMFKAVAHTPYTNYVAHPNKTGLHNYGAALDLSIADQEGKSLDMGTEFDFFGKAAGPAYETEMLQKGLLTSQHIANRKLLRQVMQQAGFQSIRGEWWHFNACSLNKAKQKYPLLHSVHIKTNNLP